MLSPGVGLVRLLFCIGCFLLPKAALCVSPEEKSAARDAATAGIRAFQDGDYDTALELLRKAEQVVHAPPHLIYIARAHAAKGEFVLARETLMVLINEVLPPDAPSAFRDAQAAGQTLKAEIEPKIGRLSIRVEGAKDTAVVTVDGKVVPDAILGLPYPVDPGLRTVVAKTEAGQEDEVFVTVQEGQSQEVTLQLGPPSAQPQAPETKPEAAPAPPPKSEPAPARRPASPWVFVGFGTAAAGVIVGSISGAVSLAKTNDAKEYCVQASCDAAAEPMLTEANAAANVSNVAFAVAGVGVGVGVIALLTGPKSQSARSSRAGSPPGRLAISPQGVRADFAWQF